jgi:hypothetical protein
MTGLIIGSMAPDFEYFIMMQMRRTHGHDMSSFFWFNLPLCILLSFLFHQVVKVPLTNSLPHFLYKKLAVHKSFDWPGYVKKHWLVVIYSFAIGVLSHIVWDSFTHDHGLFGKSPDILLQSWFGSDLKVFEALQWISTLLGGAFVLRFVLKMEDHQVARRPLWHKFSFWFHILIVMCFIFTVRRPDNLSELIATGIGSFLYGVVASACYTIWNEKIYAERNTEF